jgi:hypothetical protein
MFDEYEKDFNYDDTFWEDDNLVCILNDAPKEQLSKEAQSLLDSF